MQEDEFFIHREFEEIHFMGEGTVWRTATVLTAPWPWDCIRKVG